MMVQHVGRSNLLEDKICRIFSICSPDVLIYKRPPSAGVDPISLMTGVILELQSGGGKYNSYPNIGKAARYGKKMLESLMGFRRSVLVGVTDLDKVQWFKVVMEDRKRFMYEVHIELNDVHGLLCALLNSSLSDLEVELPVLAVARVEYEPIRFLGSGATSNVLCERRGFQRICGKYSSSWETCRMTIEGLLV